MGTTNLDSLSLGGDLNVAGTITGDVDISASLKFDDGEGIVDTNDNELLSFGVTASAVNELTITNAATGNNVSIAATGGDANIGVDFLDKGTGGWNFRNEDAGATGAVITAFHNSASPANNDVVGRLNFDGNSDSANQVTYGYIDGVILDNSDGSEVGELHAYVAGGGSPINVLKLKQSSVDVQVSGLTVLAETLTPNNDDGGDSTISAGTVQVDVGAVTNDANDWITLPSLSSVPVGHEIRIACNAGGNFELRTPASSDEKINNVDADGTQEYLCTDTDTVRIWKVSDSQGWCAQSITNLGAVRTAVVPD